MKISIKTPKFLSSKGWENGSSMKVHPAGKPPKLRFKPGQFINLENQLYEILYCYRTKENPSEWLFCLEERKVRSSEPQDLMGKILESMGAGKHTPRIVYEVFDDYLDAMRFFDDVPRNGDSRIVSNKTLIQKGQVV